MECELVAQKQQIAAKERKHIEEQTRLEQLKEDIRIKVSI